MWGITCEQEIAAPQFDASVEAQPADYPAATVPLLGETDTLDLDNLDLIGNSRVYGFGEGNATSPLGRPDNKSALMYKYPAVFIDGMYEPVADFYDPVYDQVWTIASGVVITR